MLPIDWEVFLESCKGTYIGGSSKIYFMQSTGYEISGTFTVNPLDNTSISITWDSDTYPTNTLINTGYRSGSPGTFDAIVNPQTFNPANATPSVTAGTRYLIVENIGSSANETNYGPTAWRNSDDTDFVAVANDIIEWTGTAWHVIFDSQVPDQLIRQTNIYTGIQYLWNNVSWVKSFEGEYRAGLWRVTL